MPDLAIYLIEPHPFPEPVRDIHLKDGEPAKRLWLWCFHCARPFPALLAASDDGGFWGVGVPLRWRNTGQAVPLSICDPSFGPQLCCPFGDCDGSPLDLWRWNEIREKHPEYPEVPEIGFAYAMYTGTPKEPESWEITAPMKCKCDKIRPPEELWRCWGCGKPTCRECRDYECPADMRLCRDCNSDEG